MEQTFLSVDEVAELLRTSRMAIYLKIYRREFPEHTFVRIGKRRYLFVKEALLNFILTEG
jgi:excisionase family DNA binding protein